MLVGGGEMRRPTRRRPRVNVERRLILGVTLESLAVDLRMARRAGGRFPTPTLERSLRCKIYSHVGSFEFNLIKRCGDFDLLGEDNIND